VVLPDGILNAVPFDLLTLEQTGYRAMIEDKVVRIAPSIKYLVRSYKQGRHRRAAGLFALADPTFDEEPRIGGLSGTELRAVARGNKYLAYFKSLPETRTEAESIAKMFKGKPVKIFYGADASESALKKADLLPYDYLHLATHGILGGDVPGINEPALVLAAETAEDGFFTASEAADLKLDAELAVLSACNTGVGKYFTGEGVMGMSRSFLLAGSRSVLVSLWSVPSKETEQLMVAFYKYLRAGDSPPEAIRRAKLEMMKDRPPQVSKNVKDRGIIVPQKEKNQGIQTHPFYWAAFIPFGM
jgi:CHAT domain-containing protein